jgi:hypothetical protein
MAKTVFHQQRVATEKPTSQITRAQVDSPECCQGGRYAVQFILKSRAFLLESSDYRLHQCLWHRAILSPEFGCAAAVPTGIHSFSTVMDIGSTALQF